MSKRRLKPPRKMEAPPKVPRAGAAASPAPPRTGTARDSAGRDPVRGWRRWAFRLAALVGIPLLLLLASEAGLRLLGFGTPSAYFLKVRWENRPVYVENQGFSRLFFPPALVRHPEPSLLPVVKSSNTFRIFIFGESAAMGDPQPAFGFARVMQALLQERFPDWKFEVANTGITAIDSHVVLPIARDGARRQGELWVVYMGNNEVVGPYGAGTVFGAQVPSLGLIRTSVALQSARLGQALAALWRRVGKENQSPKMWAGMEMFLHQQLRSDDPRMERVYHHFQRNLQDILRSGVQAGAKILVCTLASNLKDCAPFASLHRPDLAPAALVEWEQAYKEGAALQAATNYAGALAAYVQAARLDAGYADLDYRRGQCYWNLAQYGEARACFERARDEDALRFRPDQRINTIVRQAASGRASRGVYLVDGEGALASHSPHGVTGDELLFEHVHLTFEGNYWLGRALAEQVATLLPGVHPVAGSTPARWPTLEQCARRLAFTDWDRYQGTEIMWKRMQQPPFTNQSDWAKRNERWESRLAQLRPQTKPFAVRRLLQVYHEAVARQPEDWYLRDNYARLLQAAGDDPAAIEQFRLAIRLEPHNVQGYYALGVLLDNRGQSLEAQRCFQEALRLRPEFPEALNGLGLCLVNQGQYAAAARAYQRAIFYNPEFVASRVNLGLVLTRLGQADLAVAQYEAALRLNPNSPAAHINLGKLLVSRGQTAEAARHYEEAVRLAPEDPIAHFNLGNALAALGQPAEATAQFALAVRFDPDFFDAHLNLGLQWAQQNRLEEAVTQFTEAVRLKPDHANAQLNLGVALAKLQRYAEAIPHFQAVLRVDPANAQAQENLRAAQALAHPRP